MEVELHLAAAGGPERYTAAVINFNCTKCGQLMTVRPDFAGRPGNCPQCRQPFVVPGPGAPPTQATPPGLAPLPPSRTGAPPPPAPPITAQGNPRVDVIHGPDGFVGKTFPLDRTGSTVLGRDPGATLRIPSERVSRRHCEIAPTANGFMVRDLGSSNGTLVNQVRIPSPQRLNPGDHIQTGDCLFRFSL